MGEIESLAIEEELDRHVARHAIDRLIMLSDGVFAIAITLAAIEIHVPLAGDLPTILAALNVPLFAYLISFIVIAMFWVSNRDLFARLQRIDRPFTALVLATLCLTALIPASVRITAPTNGELDGAFRFYALIMALSGTLNFVLWIYASLRPGIMSDRVDRSYRIKRIVQSATQPLLFAIILAIPTVAMLKWMAVIAIGIIVLRRFVVAALAKRLPPSSDALDSG